MTDNFNRYRELIRLTGGLPDNNDHGNLDKYYVVELIRRGKDNPDLPAANYHFRNYYIYSWKDLDRYEEEIKSLCHLLNCRAYCSVNYKRMSQVALDTIAESARRIAAHDYKKFYNIFESCSGKFVDRSNSLWVVDIDDVTDTTAWESYINTITSGHNPVVIFKMPTKIGVHLICHPFNMAEYHTNSYEAMGTVLMNLPDVKKNHLTLLYEDLT